MSLTLSVKPVLPDVGPSPPPVLLTGREKWRAGLALEDVIDDTPKEDITVSVGQSQNPQVTLVSMGPSPPLSMILFEVFLEHIPEGNVRLNRIGFTRYGVSWSVKFIKIQRLNK